MKLVLFPCHNGNAGTQRSRLFLGSAEGFCFQAQPPCVGRGLVRRRERGWLVGLALAELALTIDKDVSGRLGLGVVLFTRSVPQVNRQEEQQLRKKVLSLSVGTQSNKGENDVDLIKFATDRGWPIAPLSDRSRDIARCQLFAGVRVSWW